MLVGPIVVWVINRGSRGRECVCNDGVTAYVLCYSSLNNIFCLPDRSIRNVNLQAAS